MWLQIVCGTYPKQTYVFAPPVGLWKVVVRVPVRYSDLFASIYWFALYKISFKFVVKDFFVDCWLVYIIFIVSEFIDPETCSKVWLKIFSRPYTKRTYGFALPAGLWKVVARVTVFVISPVAINTLIGFKAVPQFIQVLTFEGKCRPKGHKVP